MASSHPGVSGIDQVRARLDALVELRTSNGWTSVEEAEYEELVVYERDHLPDRA